MLDHPVAAHGLAGFRAAHLEDVAAGGCMPEIVVKTDDPVHFGLRNIQRVGDQGDGSLVDIAEFLLQCMQNRQKRAGKLLQALG